MNPPLLLLHEEALRITHPVFKVAPPDTKAIFIWDDDYFRFANYSLKRLVFIYETICELPVDIIRGNKLDVIQHLAPTTLYVPASNNPMLISIIQDLSSITHVETIDDESFSTIKKPLNILRFSKYWKKIESSVFKHNGDINV